MGIGIAVDPSGQSDGIGLEVSSGAGVIGPSSVVMVSGLRIKILPGES
jgi:hypothetical protein